MVSSRSPRRWEILPVAGGLLGAVLASILTVALAVPIAGRLGLISAAGAAALVIAYFGLGQLIAGHTLRRANRGGLVITMVGYLVRVVLLGVLLWLSLTQPGIRTGLSSSWAAAGAIAAVFGWLTGLLVVNARARVPIYDREYRPPEGWEDS